MDSPRLGHAVTHSAHATSWSRLSASARRADADRRFVEAAMRALFSNS
jgi:hypothetical protein